MGAILDQLGLDQTFFIQFGIFAIVFLYLPNVFFRPFQKLIETRHQKTVEDREKAEELVRQADQKFEEYRQRISQERAKARGEMDRMIAQVKAEEATLLNQARTEAKSITQSTLEKIQGQSAQLKRSLEADVEGLALQITDILLKKQG